MPPAQAKGEYPQLRSARGTPLTVDKCDRELPCSNCKFRNKEAACRYESATSRTLPHDHARPLRFDPPRDPASPPYARRSTESPLAATTQKLHGTHLGAAVPDADAVRGRYKDLVRQLPTGPLVDHLVEVYFRDINWQYYPLEHADFLLRLAEWRRAPLAVFASAGPGALPPEMRAFPALLFQVLANALLAVPDDAGGPFAALKYTADMTLQDLGGDYCDSGEAVLALLGRGDVSVTRVQAGLLRAMFFKQCLRIVDAVCLSSTGLLKWWVGWRWRLTGTVACSPDDHCRCAGDGAAR